MLKFFPPTPQEKLGRFAQIPSVIQIPLEITKKKIWKILILCF